MHDQAVATFVFLPGICMRFNAQIDLVCYGLKAFHRHCVVFVFYIKNSLPQHIQDFHGTGLGSIKKRSLDFFYRQPSNETYHWTAVDKERSDNGLLTMPKLVTWKFYICIV